MGLGTPADRVVFLHGLRFHAMLESECVAHILDSIDHGKGGWVVTPNVDIVRLCSTQPGTLALVTQADLIVADGMPVVWASRIQGTPLPERVSGSNLMSSVSAEAARRGRSIFLLGGAPDSAESAAARLKTSYPSLRIAGTHCPPLGFEGKESSRSAITAAVHGAKPDIIYVALGTPKQEFLIAGIKHLLPSSWWLGVGASFSFLSGQIDRAPVWMQKTGLEWLHRLHQEPRRLAKRYLLQGLPFAAQLLGKAALERLRRRKKAWRHEGMKSRTCL
jgi:N-acetylglucosaminyldiphosphoundecaprenol N-acetyl-beta-D-mannosaminyltransferase